MKTFWIALVVVAVIATIIYLVKKNKPVEGSPCTKKVMGCPESNFNYPTLVAFECPPGASYTANGIIKNGACDVSNPVDGFLL